MTIEHARAHAHPKPWGVSDLRPWSDARHDGEAIGEIWYERPGQAAADSSLLLKLLFTSQPLSIQVHPDDAYAQSIGLPNGKTEAWYVLSAAPEAQVALGLKQRDDSASNCVTRSATARSRTWSYGGRCRRATSSSCPPGRSTRLAPGSSSQSFNSAAIRRFACSITAGSASFISKTRWRSRTPGRPGSGCSRAGSATNGPCSFPVRISCSKRFDLPPHSAWCLGADRETWLLVLGGGAQHRIVRRRHRRRRFHAVGSRRHRHRLERPGRPAGLHRHRPGA